MESVKAGSVIDSKRVYKRIRFVQVYDRQKPRSKIKTTFGSVCQRVDVYSTFKWVVQFKEGWYTQNKTPIFTGKEMSMEENQELKEKLAELQEFVSNNRDLREWKRGEAVRLRLLGVNYQAIKQRLGVSTSFISQSQRKYK